ncbi:lysoplasmalogenase [Fictibacillus phosphorivorans]|uniref:lysoplasmalogenase n=1 Tax=Fictibacillus phosphorivorans TaxID=1221500 RepID=UPI00204124F8|nr:lysoplasmalogenase [Fictibacillus phosphorivorans]MCM3718141.1 lysoplasmalogenase [Fictibacillus phosphorivorans]MCM3775768.1 lysoplasmalogenase [Fictibacillus phosphorivorans]
MIFSLFTAIILLSSLTYLWAIKHKNQSLIYLLKPGTMLLIILFALTGTSSPYAWWVIVGLVFSLMGDIFLMLPKDRFLYGLFSFLIAHVCYIIAFLQINLQQTVSSFFTVGLQVIALLFFILILKRKRFKGRGSLSAAVFLYIMLITGMVWVSLLTGNPLLITAALLFYFSDATLAWDRFIQPLRYRHYFVMSTYFLAQYLFALSIHQ